MACSSNISIVVPLPSFDIDPLKKFDEDFFDRAVDTILSEEVSMEESREEMDDNIGISSPFGNDGTADSSASAACPKGKSKSKSPHFATPSTSSPTKRKKSKPKSPAQTMKDVSVQDENRDDQMAIDDTEMTAEDKIFASIDMEKQMEVLQFIAAHPFMANQARPVVRSARTQFTDEVRQIAGNAGLDDPSTNDLIDLVRKTYLEDRGITAAENVSTFGDEVDDEEEPSTKPSHRKRRKSDSDHYEEKEHKKTKRRHSDKHRRRSDEPVSLDDTTKGVEAPVSTEVSTEVPTEAKENGSAQADAPETPMGSVLDSRNEPSAMVDLTGSWPVDELVVKPQANLRQSEDIDAIGDLKSLNASNDEEAQLSRHLLDEMASAYAPKVSIPESPPVKSELQEPQGQNGPDSRDHDKKQKHHKARNQRKRQRQRERKKEFNKQRASLSAQTQTQGNPFAQAAEEQTLPSTPTKQAPQSPNGSGRSSVLPALAADPAKWDLDF
ncbi:hypothetical protein N7457_004117 [Penicillium paradoxum]|uniref:uncharacterized protein n=1 Tax=Penicillium paradoxum TaxID=176176 RepID=UPI00254742C9|nr:uncharacterized protein N7457_004117 [Penicillium paradoxum]KAJ5782343.1 hypothetical protein N7457_004117 [Penicillium paradoxum]